MGCDMHCIVEALNKKTKNWDCFGVSQADRNYRLFSKIADVRNSEKEETYIEPIDDPRGWPGDISGPAEAWSYNNDITYSHTWLNRHELESLYKWLGENQEVDLWKMLGFGHLTFFFNFEDGWKKAAFKNYSDLRVLFFFSG